MEITESQIPKFYFNIIPIIVLSLDLFFFYFRNLDVFKKRCFPFGYYYNYMELKSTGQHILYVFDQIVVLGYIF